MITDNMTANLISLKCPECGGELSIPDNLSVAHCIYCGAKILITEGSSNDQLKLKSYIDLCEAAFAATNYQEALDYSNRILEIDPRNVAAWINKAKAAFWLTTGANNRYDEAISYLDKAGQFDPDNPRIKETKIELTKLQAMWIFKLGGDKYVSTIKIFKIWNEGQNYLGVNKAREETREDFISAVRMVFQASNYDPDSMDILYSLSEMVSSLDWIPWSDEFRNKAKLYDDYKKKQEAEEALLKYRGILQQAEIELSNAKQGRGLFAGMKIKQAEGRVKELKDSIAYYERLEGWEGVQ